MTAINLENIDVLSEPAHKIIWETHDNQLLPFWLECGDFYSITDCCRTIKVDTLRLSLC